MVLLTHINKNDYCKSRSIQNALANLQQLSEYIHSCKLFFLSKDYGAES